MELSFELGSPRPEDFGTIIDRMTEVYRVVLYRRGIKSHEHFFPCPPLRSPVGRHGQKKERPTAATWPHVRGTEVLLQTMSLTSCADRFDAVPLHAFDDASNPVQGLPAIDWSPRSSPPGVLLQLNPSRHLKHAHTSPKGRDQALCLQVSQPALQQH